MCTFTSNLIRFGKLRVQNVKEGYNMGPPQDQSRKKTVSDDSVKGKSFVCLTNQALCHDGVWGSGCIDPCFLTSALVGG
jgi:hypothetical protein